jgi:acyl-coenzyme A thioesterase PaaI-like protein
LGKSRRNTHLRLLCRTNLHNAFKNTDPICEIDRYHSDVVNTADVDFRITSLEVGRCRGILKRNRRSDGPFKCIHGIALNLFAETLAGLAVFTRLGAHGKGILLKSEIEFIKKAKGSDCIRCCLFI